MTTSLAVPIAAPSREAEPGPVLDWRVVPTKSHVRLTVGRFLGAVHGELNNVSGVVRLIEGQPRYTHVDIRVPVTTLESRARRRLGLNADLYPYVSFYGWRIRGNPRRSFALDGELRVGEVSRQVVANVIAVSHRLDDAKGNEEAEFHAQLVVDSRIRLVLDVTLSRQVSHRQRAPSLAPRCRRVA